MRHILIAIASLLLGACGTTLQRTSAPEPRPMEPEQRPSESGPQTPSMPARRSGGYYKDDGPGDNPPSDLASIPDAQPRAEPLHRYANEPYSALGQDYKPSKQLTKFRQRGLASWYGRMFHGRKTSTGETYDMYAMTAAHPTLPLPSYARVTNVGSGTSVVVRVNDRGPFHPGRVIDLSYAAATRLGYVAKGHTLVEVESIIPDEGNLAVAQSESSLPRRSPAKSAARPAPSVAAAAIPDASPARPAVSAAADPIGALAQVSEDKTLSVPRTGAADSPGIFVQLGAFRSNDKAEGFRDKVKREISWLTQKLLIDVSSGMYRLHIGPYGSLEDAYAIAARIGEALRLTPLVIRR